MVETQDSLKDLIFKYSNIEVNESTDYEIYSGIGGRIWKSSIVLVSYIKNNKLDLENKVVVEIGAGTGVCGLVASTYNAKSVFITDKDPGVLEVIQKNIHLNEERFKCKNVKVASLNWQDVSQYDNVTEPVDIIIGSDLLYSLSMIDSLVFALENLSNDNTVSVLTLNRRGEGECDAFFKKLNQSEKWDIEILDHGDENLDIKYHSIYLCVIKRKI
jgi:predicted nicotinamide N-methyase